ncbi:MAG: hypothetical protein IPN10_09940 [Saprospiraceae bacterium]|nr:hypothetical protein [Saprospiraceae bacterium]
MEILCRYVVRLCLGYICCIHSTIVAQQFPALPVTDELITCFPDTTGYKRFTVGPTGRDYSDLQRAIDEVPLGSVLELDAGAVFFGSFNLPKRMVRVGLSLFLRLRQNYLKKKTELFPINPQGFYNFPRRKIYCPKS